MMSETRICTSCKKELELHHFGKSSCTKDGIQRRCKECNRLAFHAKQARNKERARIESMTKKAGVVPPRRINVLEGTYMPTHTAYQRNDGHRHIGSRGISC